MDGEEEEEEDEEDELEGEIMEEEADKQARAQQKPSFWARMYRSRSTAR